MTTIEGYPDFVKVNSLALSATAREVLGTSPLTLLLYLQTRACFTTGKRSKPYDHQLAADALGVSLHTVKEYLKRLVKAGLVVVKRLAHGLTFAIALPGVPTPDLSPSLSEVQESALHQAERESQVQIPALHEVQESALQPLRGENPDSESTNQRIIVGGGGPVVGGPPALAPPAQAILPERFSEETLEAIRLGEELQGQPIPQEARIAVGYALDALPADERWPVLQDTIRLFAKNPHWSQKVPRTWGEQIKKAAAARRLGPGTPKTQGDYWMAQVLQAKGAGAHGVR